MTSTSFLIFLGFIPVCVSLFLLLYLFTTFIAERRFWIFELTRFHYIITILFVVILSSITLKSVSSVLEYYIPALENDGGSIAIASLLTLTFFWPCVSFTIWRINSRHRT